MAPIYIYIYVHIYVYYLHSLPDYFSMVCCSLMNLNRMNETTKNCDHPSDLLGKYHHFLSNSQVSKQSNMFFFWIGNPEFGGSKWSFNPVPCRLVLSQSRHQL